MRVTLVRWHEGREAAGQYYALRVELPAAPPPGAHVLLPGWADPAEVTELVLLPDGEVIAELEDSLPEPLGWQPVGNDPYRAAAVLDGAGEGEEVRARRETVRRWAAARTDAELAGDVEAFLAEAGWLRHASFEREIVAEAAARLRNLGGGKREGPQA